VSRGTVDVNSPHSHVHEECICLFYHLTAAQHHNVMLTLLL